MSDDSLRSLADYSRFVAETLDRPSIRNSTVTVWSDSPYTGVAEGEVFFENGIRLRLREEFDFDAGLIASYGYEVYRGDERLYWYDDFPIPTIQRLLPHIRITNMFHPTSNTIVSQRRASGLTNPICRN